MIQVHSLSKRYGDLSALDSISFHIDTGDIVGFLGPNGAGKTTTMKILTCFMPPSSGDVHINGLSIKEHSYEIRKLIGYLPENNPLYEELTVEDYLNFVAELREIPLSIKKKAIDNSIERCHLQSVRNQIIGTCSKGFKQRVGLAQAILHDPKVLILDEPTSGLDPHQIIEMRSLIKTLQEDCTILICSHILSEITETCSKVFILNKGSIVANEPIEKLMQRQRKVIHLESDINPDTLTTLLSTAELSVQIIDTQARNHLYRYTLESETDARQALYQCIKGTDFFIQELSLEKENLEDIFVRLTRN